MDYTVADSSEAPSSLTYGPSFISKAASYGGEVIIGLNRRLDDISNTIEAAKVVQSEADNLYAIELGNEPNCKAPFIFLLNWSLTGEKSLHRQ